jgi:signal peptidase II
VDHASVRTRAGRVAGLVAWAATACTIVLVARQGILFQSAIAQFGLAAALGGAASNLLDRFARGVVVDFVAVGPWPAFNLADAAITTGALVAILFARA